MRLFSTVLSAFNLLKDMATFDPEERSRKAREFFRDGYNCCQSVLLAFQDVIGLPQEEIARISSGFGGGMGRLREVCGAVSGMVFMAGVISPADHPENADERRANYALVQEFAENFRKQNGSIVCRDLLGLRAGHKESPAPSTRSEQWYTDRPCERLVGCAARIVAEKLMLSPSQQASIEA